MDGEERWMSFQISDENEKGHPGWVAFLDANAGDYLISHTLSRAVPSARRGLTSVFGMGTGVTLAVCSPASLMRRLVVVSPQPSLCTHGRFFPGTRNGKLAPQTCDTRTKLHWARLQLQSVLKQGLLLSVL